MAKQLCTWATLASNDQSASASSITTIESPSVTAGNLIVVTVRCNSTSITVTSVTDTAGNTYHKIGATIFSSVTSLELWYAWNILAHAANFVTATFSSSVGSRVILAAEFKGVLASSDPFDVTANATASGQLATSGAFTTHTAEQLILAVSQHEAAGGFWYAYTNHLGVFATGNDTTQTVAMAFKIVTAIQTAQTVTVWSQPSVPRQLIVATFKLADATGGAGGAYAYA